MQEHSLPSTAPSPHPIVMIFLIILTVFIGFTVIGPLAGFFAALPFYDGEALDLYDAVQKPLENPDVKIPFYIMQGFATFIGLIVAPSLLLYVLHRHVTDYFSNQPKALFPYILTLFIVVIFMGVNSIFIEWNAGLDFPDFMDGFERWARSKEDYAAEVTRSLTQFDSTGQFLLAFLVIAILPAIGEEFVFRGLLQNEFVKITNNAHAAIWIAAILFSSIHMQFFGFIPRMLLGALFGYLYYWSGSLTIAMLAHFVNNGFAVVGLYLYQQGTLDFDVEKTEAFPWPFVILSALLTGLFLYYFKKYFSQRTSSIDR